MLVLCVRSLNNFDLPFWGGNEHVFNILITFVKMQNILQFSAKDFASLHGVEYRRRIYWSYRTANAN